VLLTTYQLILQSHDRNFLRKIPFSYLILDEAQNIKNKFSLRYKILFKLNTKHRLLLTGTPLQNNLAELWALLYFLMPQLFTSPSLRDYKTAFPQLQKSKKQNRCGDSHLVPNEAEYIQRIRKILSPFILRRLKSTVSLDLKPKIEKILFCKMTAVQQQQYEITYSMSKTVWLQHLQQQQQQQQQQQPQVLEEVKNKRKFIVDSDNEFAIHDDSCETSIISIPNCNVTTSSNKIHSDYNNKSLGVIFYNILMRLRKVRKQYLQYTNIL
jgi:SNF2 family DNA or RNA helicase